MSRHLVRVVKVGGSLFDWPEFPDRLWLWLQTQPPAENQLIAGGGALADAVRAYDALHRLGETRSHRLCLELLRTTGRLLEDLLALAAARHPHVPRRQQAIRVLDVASCLSDPELVQRSPITLPETWDVTTDSLAAHLAELLNADELVLLKSAALEQSCSVQQAAQLGYVDPFFPRAAARLTKIRAVNLRDDKVSEWKLESGVTNTKCTTESRRHGEE
ncbi:MAG TPA: hypothetical protein VL096_15295 [Pirellulaceae bacterium]|nr:hypothetical protein [Pirellulaceae bacterium]